MDLVLPDIAPISISGLRMKLSLQEIREENLTKPDAIEPKIGRLVPRYVPKIQLDRSGPCKKHGALHKQAARLGSQKTKAKRWKDMGERFNYSTSSFMPDREFKNLEEAHKKARDEYHKEPCTCPATN